jgi:hypothetical protein
LLDYALTLHGQPAAYWGGDSAAVNELSPETRRLLANGVLASAAGLALWITVVTGLLLLLPRPAALFVAVGVTVGHTVGATTWLWQWPAGGYQAGLWLCLAAALGLLTTIIWDERARFAADSESDGWTWVRWLLIAMLAGVPVYAFLWPH